MKLSHLAVLAAPLTLSGCALLTLSATKRSHPALEGAVTAVGLGEPITIRRDGNGVPHIEAGSEADAWYGLGYVHAQDRLFQLDLSRRLAHGEVSALLGERAVDLDAFVAVLELERRGRAALDAASPQTLERVAAYTAGINAGAASLKVPPVEHRLLGRDFEPFDEVDTTAFLFLMGWSLQENLDHELAAMAFPQLPPDELSALFDTYPDTPPIDPYWSELRSVDFGDLTAGFEAFTGTLGGRPESNAEASNNWVVSGERTASGKPILANDPHLVQAVPSLWYAAHLRGGDLHVAGATFPGVPGVPIGHNERVAWGLTNVMADTVDLAVLQRSGDDAVIVRGQPEPLVDRVITVQVADAEPVQRTVRTTSLGPVINEGGDVVLVMRWAGLEVDDRTPDVLTGFVHATSTADLLQRVDLPSVAPQNLVVADLDGHIAWQVTGSIPRRHGFTGRVPHPASDGANHWDGFLDALPGLADPEQGYLVTANHKPGPDQPNVDAIATAYLPPHRHDRIASVLATLPAATPADMHDLQLDVRENAAATYLPGLLDGVTPSPEAAPCHALLSQWDHIADIDSPEAAAWGVFQEELFRATLGRRLDPSQLSMLLDLMGTGRNPLDGDFDRFLAEAPDAVDTALAATCRRLSERFGRPEDARWGDLRPLQLRHPFAASSKLLSGWNMREAPFPGTAASVACADYDWTADEWSVGFMASMRLVMPLDDFDASTFVHPGGQSGQPGSPYYRSHYDEFVGGSTLPLWFDEDSVRAATVHTLVIEPGE
jgi:penicillin amidase